MLQCIAMQRQCIIQQATYCCALKSTCINYGTVEQCVICQKMFNLQDNLHVLFILHMVLSYIQQRCTALLM